MTAASPGRIVHYRLTDADVDTIVAERMKGDGARGNVAREGDVVPLLVVVAHENPASVNGQAFLDGNHSLWVTSAAPSEVAGDRPGTWSWPPRVGASA